MRANWHSRHHVWSSHRVISSQLPVAEEPLTIGASISGQSGRTYTVQEVLSELRELVLCVYRARYDLIPRLKE